MAVPLSIPEGFPPRHTLGKRAPSKGPGLSSAPSKANGASCGQHESLGRPQERNTTRRGRVRTQQLADGRVDRMEARRWLERKDTSYTQKNIDFKCTGFSFLPCAQGLFSPPHVAPAIPQATAFRWQQTLAPRVNLRFHCVSWEPVNLRDHCVLWDPFNLRDHSLRFLAPLYRSSVCSKSLDVIGRFMAVSQVFYLPGFHSGPCFEPHPIEKHCAKSTTEYQVLPGKATLLESPAKNQKANADSGTHLSHNQNPVQKWFTQNHASIIKKADIRSKLMVGIFPY